jgi:hypothetical protein
MSCPCGFARLTVTDFFPGPVLQPRRTKGPRIVTRARALDLDHLGAEIGQVLPAPRPREHARQVKRPDM